MRLALLAAFLFVGLPAQALTCKLAPNAPRAPAVHDGDTFRAICGKRKVRVRIAGIDAPERGQPFALESRNELARLLASAPTFTVRKTGTDKYGRLVANVYTMMGEDIGRRMVARGLAWSYSGYSTAEIEVAQIAARDERAGLWRDACPIEPKRWRNKQRECVQ